MKGAIIGDIVGSIYEWNNIKTKDFPLFQEKCFFTDDTVLTCAVAYAINHSDRAHLLGELKQALQGFGRRYPHRGYGRHFKAWMWLPNPTPYNSCGNGAAMRVSPAGFCGDSPSAARYIGEITAEPTHNHPESLKAAGLVAELIWRARHGADMRELLRTAEIAYSWCSLDEIRPDYKFDVTCQGTMPAVLASFFESTDFEDAIRNAVSVGGDSDTIAAITGSIAEAYYGVPNEIWERAKGFLDADLTKVVDAFYARHDS